MKRVFVLSDIHGQLDMFHEMLEKINFTKEDELYIVGDVIDRGNDGIALLQEIRTKNNIHLLMGNHEMMMIDFFTKEDDDKRLYDKSYALMALECDIWYMNGAEPTFEAFFELAETERVELLEYLKEIPVIIPNLKVGEKDIYLSHACYISQKLESPVFKEELIKYDLRQALWYRFIHYYVEGYENLNEFHRFQGDETLLITGHTPVRLYHKSLKPRIDKHDGIINMDCGCAFEDYKCLGCLCLNDMKEYYVYKR